ncbi:hypothetical protein ACFQ9Y_06735 [Peribacillus simplex]|uniref:hypothetical protein n=1 Tax=Peribacillus simplex TaxID=1478 RepID=UPI00366A9827
MNLLKSRNKELGLMFDFELIEDFKENSHEAIGHPNLYQYDWPYHQPIRILCKER